MGYRRDGATEAGTPRMRRIRRVLWTILVLNIAVALAKLVWGYVIGSFAMQADGFHSLFDGASNVIGLLGIYLASRPADRDHPYGHGKYETYASAAIGAMLALAAWRVGSTAVVQLVSGAEPPRVDAISFAVMLTTLAINIGVTTYERHVGKRLRSEILLADASHTASDVFVSLGVIGGLLAVRMGYPAADPVIALLVAFAIARTALGVIRQAAETLSDTARIEAHAVCVVVRGVDGVLGCHRVRTRGGASEVYVDLHVQVDSAMSVEAGHAVAEAAERAVCHAFQEVADVIVHLEPFDDYQVSKTAEEIDAGLA